MIDESIELFDIGTEGSVFDIFSGSEMNASVLFTKNNNLYISKTIDGGTSWDEPIQLSNNSISSINPKIYTFDETLIVTWAGLVDNSFNIFYKTSLDAGKTWSNTTTLVEEKDCYDVKIVGQEGNIHLIWQEYYEPGWGDIWHLRKGEQKPVVTSISSSQASLLVPGDLNISVQGFDINYNKSDLTCIVQYLSYEGQWKDLETRFESDIWTSTIAFNESTEPYNLSIRSKLVNLDTEESKWEYLSNIQLSAETPQENDAAGFEIVLVIIAFISMIIVNIFKKTKVGR